MKAAATTVAKGRVILLNGSSSAGKTTLALAIARLSTAPVQHISLDQFRDGMAPRFRGMNAGPGEPGARGLNVVPTGAGTRTALRFGDVGRRTLRGMRRAAAAFASTGIDVVVDDLLLERGFLADYLEVLEDFAVTFVGVRCDLATASAREAARPGRFPGTAAAHWESVHRGCRYDVEVDTGALTPRQCAERVLAVAAQPPRPTAFERLRNGRHGDRGVHRASCMMAFHRPRERSPLPAEQPPQDELGRLRALIDSARRVAVFTGAGISTESGIPDFRSPGTGVWNRIKPIEFQDFLASEAVRRESWRRRFASDGASFDAAKPNQGHLAVARLVAAGKADGVITQNVDNLHQDAGVPDDQVVELHGNTRYAKCLDCERRFELADLKRQFEARGSVPPCAACGGIVKTATISFGQPMPAEAMARAQALADACDLFLAIGSSLVVYPAAGFPEYAKRRGARLAIVNREPTPLDSMADLALHREIGPTLGAVVGADFDSA